VTEKAHDFRRADARDRTRRDVQRFRQRDQGKRFWRSLALVGSVGWPIVLLATGSAWFGRYLDARFGTGVRFTFVLLAVGTGLGSFIAYRTVKEDGT
jgi:ATP synthase protein I